MIGLVRMEAGGYSWGSAEMVTYTNWADGQPTGNPDFGCVVMSQVSPFVSPPQMTQGALSLNQATGYKWEEWTCALNWNYLKMQTTGHICKQTAGRALAMSFLERGTRPLKASWATGRCRRRRLFARPATRSRSPSASRSAGVPLHQPL